MAQSIAYVLSKNAYPDAYQAKLIGVYQGTQIVYATTSTLTSSNVLYADSRLTQPIYGSPSDWYGVQLLTDDAVRYAVVISTTGSITPVANPTTTTTTSTSTTTTAPATTTTTSASTTSTTSAAPATTTTTTNAPTTTTTTVLFSGTISWSDTNACTEPAGSFAVTGNGTTFCNSTQLTGAGFGSLSVGTHFVAYGGQTYTVGTGGSPFASVTSACTSC